MAAGKGIGGIRVGAFTRCEGLQGEDRRTHDEISRSGNQETVRERLLVRCTETEPQFHGQRQELDGIVKVILVGSMPLPGRSEGEQAGQDQGKNPFSVHLCGMKVQR